MVFLALVFLATACVCWLGVALWVICRQLFTEYIPKDIGHPVKLRIFSCVFQLALTWGRILEKLRICSASQFVCFLHDLRPLKKDARVMVTDLHFGTIPVKLYQPRAACDTPRTGIVFYHGGGTILGSLKIYNEICLRLCKESDSVVLSVGYRMSPKYRFPVMLNDCTVATIHFLKSLNMYGVDRARVVLCGDSVGGLAATELCKLLRNHPGLPRIRAQILIYASLQAVDFQSPSFQQNHNIPFLTWDMIFDCWSCHLAISSGWKSTIKKGTHLSPEFWKKYSKWLGHENIPERFKKRGYRPIVPGPVNEDAYLETATARSETCTPIITPDDILSQLPEACIVSCEYDLLRDHSLLYKKRLEGLGVPVTWHHMEDGFHGVFNTLGFGCLEFPCSLRILNLIVHFIKGL
ncbi:arylacetamide deacetylase-like 3 [Dipodomys merriami]|uniref:arylacetamide deacetylase-like 3 n=1 Tax=Dipodomys merriami TaxID=94247 RepID=UPI003855DFA6